MSTSVRAIKQIVKPEFVIEGAGVLLQRSFGPSRANPLDPFLLFDHFAFNDPIEGPIVGFPMHPHRGIETVTYMLEGNTRHRDSLGNSGVIGPGDVQWMTSGRGIMHEEMPKRGPSGRVDGFQLWVNLPAAEKMGQPRYQEVMAASIPYVEADGISVRVVAGEYGGVKGPVTEIAAQPIYMDVTLAPSTTFTLEIPEEHTAVAYLFEGSGIFEAESDDAAEVLEAVHMVIFGEGDHLQLRSAAESKARFMLMAGAPIREAIVPYGPFVMNTEAQIKQAFIELRNGTFIKD